MALLTERHLDPFRPMDLFFTGAEALTPQVPFLVDSRMRPMTAANEWLRDLTKDGATSSPQTWKTYAYHLFDFLCFLEAQQIEWTEITNDTVLHYRNIQDQNYSRLTKHPLQRRTINARLLSLGRFYAFACDKGFIERNPLQYKRLKIRRPLDTDLLAHVGKTREYEVLSATFQRVSRPKIKWRPDREVKQWLNSIEDWTEKLIAKLMYQTGMRREEIARLRIGQLPQRSSFEPAKIEVSFPIVGKGRKSRVVYLAARDFLELNDYIKTKRSTLLRKGNTKTDSIFLDPQGRPLAPESINRMFERVSKRCGIKITPHMLRHSFAVLALQHWKDLGVSQAVKLLQSRLGHSSVTTTEIYMHLTDEMRSQEARANASLIEYFLRGESSEIEEK